MKPSDITSILDALSRRPLSRPVPNIVQLAGRLIDDVEEGSGMYGAVDPNGPEPMAEALVCLGHFWEAVGRPPIPEIAPIYGDTPCSQEHWLAMVAANAWSLPLCITAPEDVRCLLNPDAMGQAVARVLLAISALWTGEDSPTSDDAVAALPELLSNLLTDCDTVEAPLPSVTP